LLIDDGFFLTSFVEGAVNLISDSLIKLEKFNK